MPITPSPSPDSPLHPDMAIYQIRLEGTLSAHWQAWFDGLTIVQAEDGSTVLTGPVRDQAALYGLLRRARNVGLPLVSVIRLPQPLP